jgi:hypothetical protein
MENGIGASNDKVKSLWNGILETARKVITDPAGFYRAMPRTGGFGDPLVFMVVLGVAAGVLRAVLGFFHLGITGSVMVAMAAIVMTPIAVVIGGFIAAAILFVIWKLMGSNESYETAYRCSAYAVSVSPITAVLGVIPYVGPLIGLVWGLYLVVTASVEVHKIAAKTAWLVFGIITAILAIGSISGQITARRMAREMGAWSHGISVKPGEASSTFAGTARAAAAAHREQPATYEVRTKEGQMKVTAGESGVALPDTFPKDVPVYKGATVQVSMTQGKMLVVHFKAPVSVPDGLKFYRTS